MTIRVVRIMRRREEICARVDDGGINWGELQGGRPTKIPDRLERGIALNASALEKTGTPGEAGESGWGDEIDLFRPIWIGRDCLDLMSMLLTVDTLLSSCRREGRGGGTPKGTID
jgi:hypothetical protein